MMNTQIETTVEFRIYRFDPSQKRQYQSVFKVPIRKGTTLLDALLYIKDNLDESLTFRQSCRMGICGDCAINVNGRPMLACYTQVLDLAQDSLLIEPLSNAPVIKDLIVDMHPFFDTYKRIKNYLLKPAEDLKRPTEFPQSPADLKKYWDLTLCIKCSICNSACPAVIDEQFLGPSALTATYRFTADSRDHGFDERLKPMADNIWLCTQCNSCTLFCPKKLGCADAIVDDHSFLVEAGNIPRTVKDVLESVYKYHNPMGTPQSKRMDWAEDLNVQTFPTTTKADILFFVCCSNAYDLRNREAARNMATIFSNMDLSFATLGS